MAGCVSDAGVFDMVGNVQEWVADWVPQTGACSSWGDFTADLQCLTGESPNVTVLGAEALVRGAGYAGDKPAGDAGVFSLFSYWVGSFLDESGFRAAR